MEILPVSLLTLPIMEATGQEIGQQQQVHFIPLPVRLQTHQLVTTRIIQQKHIRTIQA